MKQRNLHGSWGPVGLLLALMAGCVAEPETPPQPLMSCSGLNGHLTTGGIRLTTSSVAATAEVGEYCRVTGSIRPGFDFQVNLPASWNQKLLYNGGGGWDGVLGISPGASTASYVMVASNGGHRGDPLDASFALNNPQAQQDFGYLSAHTTLTVAKEIVRKRYGSDAQRHYFQGCSNGGREALIQASRYPADYDGIVSIAPAYSFTELFQAFIRNAQALSAPGAAISAAKATTIANAVTASCDALDGLADGIVSRPQACTFDVGTLRCAGADNNSCLTDAQITAARVIYSETLHANGSSVYPGWSAGGEDQGWPAWVSNPPTSATGTQYTFADGFIRYWLTSDPGFNSLSLNAANYPTQLAAAASTLDASADLRSFFAQGRKLVLVHGTHDWAISYKGSVKYFDQVGSATGATVRDAGMEFFLLPGVQHCGGGVGPYLVDAFEATARWVESGERPSSRNLSVYKLNAAGTGLGLSRPLCRYPSYPRYRGTGDVNAASSFACTLP